MSHKTAGMLQPAREGAEVTIGEASPKPEPREPPRAHLAGSVSSVAAHRTHHIQNLLPSKSLNMAYFPPPHGASVRSTSNSTPRDFSSR